MIPVVIVGAIIGAVLGKMCYDELDSKIFAIFVGVMMAVIIGALLVLVEVFITDMLTELFNGNIPLWWLG